MNILSILKFLDKGNKRWYDRDIDTSLAFVHNFKEPKDLWERSFFQYQCNCFDLALWKKIFLNIGAVLLLPFSILVFRIIKQTVRFKKKIVCISDIVETSPVIPESLKEKYEINFKAYFAGYGLSHQDMRYLSKYIREYFNKPFFLLHNIFKIARYSNVINLYKPDVILCHNEYSYSSSILTDYCRKNNVQLFNMMHGERLINIRNSFFEYDRCYVWHEHYKNTYIELRANPNQFVVEVPPALRIDVTKKYDKNEFATYKYYLGEQSREELISIIESLKVLKQNGYSLKYRPHPRYTNMDDINQLLEPEEIENPSKVDTEVSIASSDYVIGSYSTVLLQGYLCGKGVLIDDITYKDRIEKQKKARYILMTVEGPELLSIHIDRTINNNNHE